MDSQISDAILLACDEILTGRLMQHFVVDPIQGGAGTSANMNANEVIANRAAELLGGNKGDYSLIHPNDHVNMSQSTNDVFPTAGKMTALYLLQPLLYQLQRLEAALEKKAGEFQTVVKMGRTQLQDAVPIRLGQSFQAYAAMIQRDILRLQSSSRQIGVVNMAELPLGQRSMSLPSISAILYPSSAKSVDWQLIQAENLIDATQNLDSLVSFFWQK